MGGTNNEENQVVIPTKKVIKLIGCARNFFYTHHKEYLTTGERIGRYFCYDANEVNDYVARLRQRKVVDLS